MYTTIAVQWDLCMQCGRHICYEVYSHNGKCMSSMFLLTLLIALGLYEAYILT